MKNCVIFYKGELYLYIAFTKEEAEECRKKCFKDREDYSIASFYSEEETKEFIKWHIEHKHKRLK